MAKSVLGKSGISEYCVNCYTGCLHGCIYCYARFMKRFSSHEEPWGKFLDAKVNAPEVLTKEVKRRKPAMVFMSSVCDAYQPAEKRYRLSRECLKILVDAGFPVGILTKSALVTRDLDILSNSQTSELGCTLTTMDEHLRMQIEPGASPTWMRIKALQEAAEKGVKIWAFLGPFMPGLSDTDEALDTLFAAIKHLPLSHAYFDKLNPHPGVWNEIAPFIKRRHPELLERYRRHFFDSQAFEEYCEDLRNRAKVIADAHGLHDVVRVVTTAEA